MQILCKVLAGCSDVRCPVCGQGFSVYWTRNREVSLVEQREALQNVLRAQHLTLEATDIHAAAFETPDTPVSLPPRRRASDRLPERVPERTTERAPASVPAPTLAISA